MKKTIKTLAMLQLLLPMIKYRLLLHRVLVFGVVRHLLRLKLTKKYLNNQKKGQKNYIFMLVLVGISALFKKTATNFVAVFFTINIPKDLLLNSAIQFEFDWILPKVANRKGSPKVDDLVGCPSL